MSTPTPVPQLMTDLGIDSHFDFEKDCHILTETLELVNPKIILETGFFRGGSAFVWLYYSKAKLISVDPMVSVGGHEVFDGKIENVYKLQGAFPARFNFLRKDSRHIRPDLAGTIIDLFFMDGDHSTDGVINDFRLALDLNIPYLLADDWVTQVSGVYYYMFTEQFSIVRSWDREATFQGAPIPMTLLRNNLYKAPQS